MTRFLRAFIWLRWRLLINGLKRPARRDSLEHLSRLFRVLVPILMFALFVPGALVLGGLGLVGGAFLARSATGHGLVLITIRMLLFASLAITFLSPLVRAIQGSSAQLSRFLLLPIPRGSLYLIETLSGLFDPWVFLLVPALLLFPLGLGWSGGWRQAGAAWVGGLAFIGLLAGLGTLMSSLAHLIFRNRRTGEVASFLLLAVLILVGFLPTLFTSSSPSPSAESENPEVTAPPLPESKQVRPQEVWTRDPGEKITAAPRWSHLYPPEWYVLSISSANHGRPSGTVSFPLLALVGLVGALHFVGWKTHRRLLETPGVGSNRAGGVGRRFLGTRIPGLSDAISAVALTQARTCYRTVQGKISFWMIPLMVVLIGALIVRTGNSPLPEGFPVTPGMLLAFLGMLFAFLTLEGPNLNQFANDQAGLSLSFLVPLSDRQIILGKAAGTSLLVMSRIFPSLLGAALMVPGGSWCLWVTIPVVGAAAFFLMAPVSAILSAVFPKTVNSAKRLGAAEKPHAAASFLGLFTLMVAAGPAVGLTLIGLQVLGSPLAALGLASAWAVALGLLSIPIFRIGARILHERRENLAQVAGGR